MCEVGFGEILLVRFFKLDDVNTGHDLAMFSRGGEGWPCYDNNQPYQTFPTNQE